MVTGNFNVLHPGHIRLLKFAKTCGEKLLVGVFSDQIAKEAVDNPQEMRLEALSSISMVDESFLVETSLDDFIGRHRPDIIVKGKEFENFCNPEENILKSYGGQLIFSSEANGAVYLLSAKFLQDLHRQAPILHETSIDLIPMLIDRMNCYFTKQYFQDIGRQETLFKANQWLSTQGS